jgi:hypothetical protein
MCLLELGKVKVKVTDAAQEEVYAILNIPGTGFGEWGLLTHEKRTATLIADGPCLLRELSREVYNKVSQANPAFAKILERVALGKWNASISKNGTKNESNKSQIIGRNGYKTVIHSLPAYLAEFNNKVVYPKRLKDRSSAGDLQWEVELQKDKLVVVVGEDKMDVQLDTAAVFTPSAVKKKQGQLNNHSSVKWALQDVCAQLRTAILQTIQEGSIKVQTIQEGSIKVQTIQEGSIKVQTIQEGSIKVQTIQEGSIKVQTIQEGSIKVQTIQEGSIKVQTIFAQFDTDGNGMVCWIKTKC